MNTIRLVSRNSRLAVIQAQEVISNIQNVNFQLSFVSSYGDNNKGISLITNKIADIFTRELDEALLLEKTDIAVHSAKDLPFPLPEGLEIIALTKGLSNADVLVSQKRKRLSELAPGSKVGTSSEERQKQVLAMRPDLQVVDIRGTIDERISLVETGEIQALIVAECALQRLGYEHLIAETLPFKTNPLQGNLAVVAKKGNSKLKSIFYPLDIRKNFGKVSISGYIHAHPELLTLKALNGLNKADVIFYENGIDLGFLKGFSAEKVAISAVYRNELFSENIYRAAKLGKNVSVLFEASEGKNEPLEILQQYLAYRLILVEYIPGIHDNLPSVLNQQQVKRNKILVSGSDRNDYEHLGEVVFSSFDELKPLDDYSFLKPLFSEKSAFNFIVFHTKESVHFFKKALLENNKDLRWLAGSSIVALNAGIRSELLKYGIHADINLFEELVTKSLIDFLIERQLPGKRILLLKAKNTVVSEISLLKRMGYELETLELYESIVNPVNTLTINLDEIDMVAFSSPDGVRQFKSQFSKLPGHISIISEGDDTRRSLYDTGLVQYEPEWVI